MGPKALLMSLINPSGLDEKDISQHRDIFWRGVSQSDSFTLRHPFSKVLLSILYRPCGLTFFAECGMPDGYEDITAA
jgi:hypothetical protein